MLLSTACRHAENSSNNAVVTKTDAKPCAQNYLALSNCKIKFLLCYGCRFALFFALLCIFIISLFLSLISILLSFFKIKRQNF